MALISKRPSASTRLVSIAPRVAVDKEISAITPEIGAMPAGAKKEKAEIEKLHEYLAKPLDVHEALARESQHLAVQNLALLERQFKTISRGSISLPGRSFNDLISAAGLSNVFRSIQSTADEIRVPKPDHILTPPPARRAYVAPPATTSVKTTPVQTTPLPAKAYEEAPDHRPLLIDPKPWRLAQISRTVAPQEPQVQTPSVQATQITAATLQPTATRLPAPPQFSAKLADATAVEPASTPPAKGPTKRTGSVPLYDTHPKTASSGKTAARHSITDKIFNKTPSNIENPSPSSAPARDPPQNVPSLLPNPVEQNEWLAQERRQKRRAVIANPWHPSRGRGGPER